MVSYDKFYIWLGSWRKNPNYEISAAEKPEHMPLRCAEFQPGAALMNFVRSAAMAAWCERSFIIPLRRGDATCQSGRIVLRSIQHNIWTVTDMRSPAHAIALGEPTNDEKGFHCTVACACACVCVCLRRYESTAKASSAGTRVPRSIISLP